jgi:hypothetical protein
VVHELLVWAVTVLVYGIYGVLAVAAVLWCVLALPALFFSLGQNARRR